MYIFLNILVHGLNFIVRVPLTKAQWLQWVARKSLENNKTNETMGKSNYHLHRSRINDQSLESSCFRLLFGFPINTLNSKWSHNIYSTWYDLVPHRVWWGDGPAEEYVHCQVYGWLTMSRFPAVPRPHLYYDCCPSAVLPEKNKYLQV